MKYCFVILFTLGFVLDALSQSNSRYALVIGNYSYEAGRLKNPGSDADTMSKKLSLCGFTVIEKKNLKNYNEFKTVLEDFFELINKQTCESFFYYSGHGIQQEGENYLIPVETKINSVTDVTNYCFPLKNVLGKMDDSKSSTNIIVLDACRNNPFSRGLRSNGEKGLQVVAQAPKESFIIYATSPNSVAHDGSGANSPLVTAFVRNMNEPGLSINNLLIKIIRDVNAQYPTQRPWGSVSIRKEFYFIPPGSGLTKGQQTANYTNNFERSDMADISFLANTDCTLYIDDENINDMKKGILQPLKRYPGAYNIKAVCSSDTSVVWSSVDNYTINGPNVTYINLQQKLDEKKAKIESDPAYIQTKKTIEGIKSKMLLITGGEYEMGNNSGNGDESPQHKVNLKTFYLSRFEVTQDEWYAIMGTNPSSFNNCGQCPVENVSWNDVKKFIDSLNKLSGDDYRLPTEAEWEYAARGGNFLGSAISFSGASRVDRVGWTYKNSNKKTHPVGELIANEKGINDMTGNVAEWCLDVYDGSYYRKSSYNDPAGPSNGKDKVVRGGSWDDDENNCKNSIRNKRAANDKDKTIGFRLAKNSN